jgi:hypothetical protein
VAHGNGEDDEHPTTPSARGGSHSTKPSRPSLARPPAPSQSIDIEEQPYPEQPEELSAAPSGVSQIQKSNKGLFAALGAVAVLAAGGTYFALSGSTPPPAPVTRVGKAPPRTEPPPPRPSAALVELSLAATPAEAMIQSEGESPCNPCTFSRAAGEKMKVRIEAEGHLAQDLELSFDQSRAQQFKLAPTPAQVAVKPADPAPAADPQPGRAPKGPRQQPPKKKGTTGLAIDESNPYQ